MNAVLAPRRPRQHRPFRQRRAPRPIAWVTPATVDTAALLIAERLRAVRRDHGGTAYLFVGPSGWAYAVPDTATCAEHWLRVHADWLVGCYAVTERHRADIAGDLWDHLGVDAS